MVAARCNLASISKPPRQAAQRSSVAPGVPLASTKVTRSVLRKEPEAGHRRKSQLRACMVAIAWLLQGQSGSRLQQSSAA